MSDEWAQKQLQQFRFDFDEADKDKSGSLSFKEVSNVLKAQGFKGTDEDVAYIFRHLDLSADRSINKEEFTAAMSSLPKMTYREFALRKMFKALDKDGSGYLTRDEIRRADIGIDISKGGIFKMLLEVRKDDDGKLEYDEFLRIDYLENAADQMRLIFNKLDADGSGYLTPREISKAVEADFELQLSKTRIFGLLNHLKKDDDHKISYEEFIKFWREHKE